MASIVNIRYITRDCALTLVCEKDSKYCICDPRTAIPGDPVDPALSVLYISGLLLPRLKIRNTYP